MTAEETIQDIRDVIARVIRAGLANEQKYPAIKDVGGGVREIFISGAPTLSSSMKYVPYTDIYKDLTDGGAFNIKMIDGTLVQMVYTFARRQVLSHRLAIFPSPSLLPYEDAAESYEADEIDIDVVGKYLVKVPLRFDYSSSDDEHVDVDHPKSHLTLGGYGGCRIPVNGPVTPTRFMRFILRNFYNPSYGEVNMDAAGSAAGFPDSITARERTICYLTV